jgi:hypothetical protein
MTTNQSQLLAEGMRLLRNALEPELAKVVKTMTPQQFDSTLRMTVLTHLGAPPANLAATLICLVQMISLHTNLPPSEGIDAALNDILAHATEPEESPETSETT